MSDNYNIVRHGRFLKLNLSGTEVSDFEKGLKEAFAYYDEMNGKIHDAVLETFVASEHLAELDFFLSYGFYIANTMLTMELELPWDKSVTQADTEVLKEIYDRTVGLSEYLEANEKGFGEQDPVEMIGEQLAMPDSVIHVARHKGKIISAVTTWTADAEEKVMATEDIFTVPRYREKHIAEHLLTSILKEAGDNGMKKARLTVYGDDLPAIAMYQKLGYVVTGARFELNYQR